MAVAGDFNEKKMGLAGFRFALFVLTIWADGVPLPHQVWFTNESEGEKQRKACEEINVPPTATTYEIRPRTSIWFEYDWLHGQMALFFSLFSSNTKLK